MYAAWARERGFDLDERPVDGDGALEVHVLGAYAYGYLRGECGSHRLILPPGKGDRRGETFLARVDVVPMDAGRPSTKVAGRHDEPPVRTYDMWRSRGVRDRRTGQVDGDVRAVLDGRLDRFLEAFVDQDENAPRSA